MKKIVKGMSTSFTLCMLFMFFSEFAFAHVRWSLTGLINPRTNATGLKEPAPCGGVGRTNTPVVL